VQRELALLQELLTQRNLARFRASSEKRPRPAAVLPPPVPPSSRPGHASRSSRGSPSSSSFTCWTWRTARFARSGVTR
jgi:hypothetical protein